MTRPSIVELRSVALALVLSAAAAGCGSAQTNVEAKAAPGPPHAAVTKLVRAVEGARTPDGNERAVALLREAITLDPALWEARYDLGVLLASRGELEAARVELEAAHRTAPNAEDVVCALGEVLRRQELASDAAEVLTTFVATRPGARAARRLLVIALREAGDAAAALERARELARLEPGDPRALAELALTHLALGQVDIAELLVRQALEAKPPAAVAERAAGLIALERGEDALAFAHFARATQLDPRDTAAALNVATVLLRAGVYERAEKQFRAVLDIEPESITAKLGLAAALRGQGSRDNPAPYRAAEALLRELVAAAPNDWAAAHNLAVLYAEALDRPRDATLEFERFLDRAPADHPSRARAQQWIDEHAKATAAPNSNAPP